MVKNPLAMQEIQERQIQFLSREDPLEEEMATYSSIFAWEIPWTEKLNRLQSMGSQRVRLSTFECIICRIPISQMKSRDSGRLVNLLIINN